MIIFGLSVLSCDKDRDSEWPDFHLAQADELKDMEYKIKVHQKGIYKVSVKGKKKLSGISLTITCNNEHAVAALQNEKSTIGNIKLFKGEHTLRLEVVGAEDGIKAKNLNIIYLDKQ